MFANFFLQSHSGYWKYGDILVGNSQKTSLSFTPCSKTVCPQLSVQLDSREQESYPKHFYPIGLLGHLNSSRQTMLPYLWHVGFSELKLACRSHLAV